MALKIAGSKVFPNHKYLLDLAKSAQFRIRDASEIIESTADGIRDYLATSAEVGLLVGLKESILKSIALGAGAVADSRTYRHDKKRKLD